MVDTVGVIDHVDKMAAGYALPPPPLLDVHGTQAADNWKRFKRASTNYALAIELNKKSEKVQVATLLTVIGEDISKHTYANRKLIF